MVDHEKIFEYLKGKINGEYSLYNYLIRYGISDTISDFEKEVLNSLEYKLDDKSYFCDANVCKLYKGIRYKKLLRFVSEVINYCEENEINTEFNILEADHIIKECGKSLECLDKYIKLLHDVFDIIDKLQIKELFSRYYKEFKTVYDVLSNYLVLKNYVLIDYHINEKGLPVSYISEDNYNMIKLCHKQRDIAPNEFISVRNPGKSTYYCDDIAIKIYARMPKTKIETVMSELSLLAVNVGFPVYFKTRSYETNDMLTIRIKDVTYLSVIVEFLKKYEYIKTDNHPFMPMFDGVGITFDNGGSYNSFLCKKLEELFEINKDAKYEDFIKFVTSFEEVEKSSHEEKIFIKNLVLSLEKDLKQEHFLMFYKNELEEYSKGSNFLDEFKNTVKGR